MSNMILPNVAKRPMLTMQLGLEAVPVLHCRLFKNDYVPVAATVVADLVQADFTGYSVKSLANVVADLNLDANGKAWATYNALTWTKNGAVGNTIYGYYVLRSDDSRLLWIERFDVAIPLTADGAFLTITPKYTLGSQFVNQ